MCQRECGLGSICVLSSLAIDSLVFIAYVLSTICPESGSIENIHVH